MKTLDIKEVNKVKKIIPENSTITTTFNKILAEEQPRDKYGSYDAVLTDMGILIYKDNKPYIFVVIYEPHGCYFWGNKKDNPTITTTVEKKSPLLIIYGHENVAVVDITNPSEYTIAQTR